MSPDLEAVLDAAVAARPTIDRAALAAHLATLPHVGAASAAELALAFEAAAGAPAAVAELHALVARCAPVLAATGYPAALVDDAVQETSILLLVGREGGGRPTLLTYEGRARLGAWITTIALRMASRLSRAASAATSDDAALDQLAGAHDPAAQVLKAELRPAVRAAFAAAVRRLSFFDRELLADTIVRARTIDDLARQHDVHRATAARWVGRARATLDDHLRRELGATLALAEADVASVLGAVATSIELTPARLVDPPPARRR